MLVARRRSIRHEEDMEFLDKGPMEPPMREMGVHSPPPVEDDSMTDAGHYAGAPMPLATPPAAYYPDYEYSGAHTQGYPAVNQHQGYAIPGGEGYAQEYPAVYIQDYTTHDTYSPQDYGITYPPRAADVGSGLPNPYEFTDVELGPASVSSTRATAAVPSATTGLSPTSPHQPENPHYSIDSFYTGIVVDRPPSPGQAL